jgi:cell filamentation protein, protein adenylyltransferase
VTILYESPKGWSRYDPRAIANELAEAKAVVLSLKTVPYQRRWVEALQQIELKREVAGTSRIEGAEFTDRELEAAMKETPEELHTRSQRQAHAAVKTYRWIATIPNDRPIDGDLIRSIHRSIVEGADDDHCPAGQLRGHDQNVTFGMPRHRGCEGGHPCEQAFVDFTKALQHEYRDHDPIVQAIAAHYHLAAMHTFLDGNGRTARALEALMLQRAGLRETTFISMSNYYYDEKNSYLAALAETRKRGHDLTPFLAFALKGVALQCRRVLAEIQRHIQKELFRSLAMELFGRLVSARKRPLAQRQLEILYRLLDVDSVELNDLVRMMRPKYEGLKRGVQAVVRDLNHLKALNAISIKGPSGGPWTISARLEWPAEVTETDFFKKVRELPKAKTLPLRPFL